MTASGNHYEEILALCNFGTAILASLVISLFDATLEQMVALAVLCLLLPQWEEMRAPRP